MKYGVNFNQKIKTLLFTLTKTKTLSTLTIKKQTMSKLLAINQKHN